MYGTVQNGSASGRKARVIANTIEAHVWNSCPTAFDVVALAASAGGLAALRSILERLPFDFAVPILILQHRACRDSEQDVLVTLLRKWSNPQVMLGCHGMRLTSGVAYVAPPGRHLLLSKDRRIQLSDESPVRHNKPSADLLFASLAAHFGSRLIVAVLSGSRNDGAVGVVSVKACGGTVLVQDPATASCAGMPRAAISTGCADFVLPIDRIGDALTTLAMVPGAADLFSRSQSGRATQ